VQIGKTTPVFGHVQSQCTNIMRELGVLGFWVFGRGRRQAQFPQLSKDAARVFWTRVQQKGCGVLGERGCAKWVSDGPSGVGISRCG